MSTNREQQSLLIHQRTIPDSWLWDVGPLVEMRGRPHYVTGFDPAMPDPYVAVLEQAPDGSYVEAYRYVPRGNRSVVIERDKDGRPLMSASTIIVDYGKP
jgi:hypothetical protein